MSEGRSLSSGLSRRGTTRSVDGFYVVDEEKLRARPEAAVVELHRNGMLMLLNLHLLSLGNIRHLVDRKALRMAEGQGAAAASRLEGESGTMRELAGRLSAMFGGHAA